MKIAVALYRLGESLLWKQAHESQCFFGADCYDGFRNCPVWSAPTDMPWETLIPRTEIDITVVDGKVVIDPGVCQWTLDPTHGIWHTGCAAVVAFAMYGPPDQYGYHYCPNCGKRVRT